MLHLAFKAIFADIFGLGRGPEPVAHFRPSVPPFNDDDHWIDAPRMNDAFFRRSDGVYTREVNGVFYDLDGNLD